MSETTSRAHALHSPWSVRLSDYWAITKPGIAGAVLMTSVSSFLAGGGLAQADGWIRLFNMTLGTALTAFGAGALNMLWEAEPDALMDRTRNRPLPSGRMASQEALIFGILCGLLGIVHLVTTCGAAAGLAAALSLGIYVLLYTPLKKHSSVCTVVGAVSGALPPLIGWSAAGRAGDPHGWVLFAVLFLWQFPHLLVLAWMYRADYARAGFRMMPISDESGAETSRWALALCLLLTPLSLLPYWTHMTGPFYAGGCLAMNALQIFTAVRFFRLRTPASAKRFFLSTVFYPPVLFLLLFLGL
jgi:protoheme IX farnesyltransferase